MIEIGITENNPGRILNSESPFLGEIRPEIQLSPPPSNGTRYTIAVARPRGRKVFETIEHGYRAIFLILRGYKELYGLSTLESLLGRWCRERAISSRDYSTVVARRLGIHRGGYIDTQDEETMVLLVRSMVRVELGITEDLDLLRRAWGMIGVNY